MGMLLFAMVLLAQRPATCTPGVGYWDVVAKALYTCGPVNVWSVSYVPKDVVPPDPCIDDPLKITGVKWPTARTQTRSLTWNSSTKQVVEHVHKWPLGGNQSATFTDGRGCSVTVNR